MQRDIRHQVEHEYGQFIDRHAGIMNGVETFPGHDEESGVDAVHEAVGKDEESRPPQQHAEIDQGAPEQNVSDLVYGHDGVALIGV